MKRLSIAAVAVAVIVVVLVAGALPPSRVTLPPAPDGTVAGVLHVHTNRSDGRSDPAAIAAAAARAGLRFVVFTDHGDGTRTPDPPTYRSGVLCLDGVEISTSGGHYIAIGLPAAPYPLGGEARDVVEDVARLGGFGFAAHPDSPKSDLAWREWSAPIDGLELINPDTTWRARVKATDWRRTLDLVGAVGAYPIRGVEVIASLIENPGENMIRWDDLTRTRPIVGISGSDAHAKLAIGDREPGDNWLTLPLPGYETAFRAMSVHVRPETPFRGNASDDAKALIAGLRAGHLYSALDGLATPPSFTFSATSARGSAEAGATIEAGEPLTLHVRSNAPDGFTTTIVRDGRAVATGTNTELKYQAGPDPAVYRVEIHAADRRGSPPWILSNPIYVRAGGSAAAIAERSSATTSRELFEGHLTDQWNEEHASRTQAAVRVETEQGSPLLLLTYTLSNETERPPFVALTTRTPEGVQGFDRLTFTASSSVPTRVSVQLRASWADGDRWQRSVYLDATSREHTVYSDNLTPVPPATSTDPRLSEIRTILFVLDSRHAKPGSSGELRLTRAALQR